MRRKMQLSMESVQYQDNTFYQELSATIEYLRTLPTKQFDGNIAKWNNQLAALIGRRFGFTQAMVHIGEQDFGIVFHNSNTNHALNDTETKELHASSRFIDHYLKEAEKGFIGAVNIHKAKVTGIFTTMGFTITIPLAILRNLVPGLKLTSDELAAQVLHEIGHFFIYCEYFSRTVSTNQALSALSKQLLGNETIHERIIAIQNAADEMRVTVDVDALAKSKKEFVEVALVSEAAELSRQELGISVYDDTACEYLADQFANRFGAGSALASALDKIHRFGGYTWAYHGTPLHLFKQMVVVASYFTPYVNLITIPLSLVYVINGAGTTGNIYDEPEARYKRIRFDAINRLKNPKLSQVDKTMILADIKVIDDILVHVKDKTNFLKIIAGWIPIYRKYRHTTQLQQQLEALGNSSLFARAAELSTLSSH